MIPTSLWGLTFPDSGVGSRDPAADAGFHLHPHYRTQRPLDATLLKVQAGLDEFITEKYADQIAAILAEWSASLLQSPRETRAIAKALAADFSGDIAPARRVASCAVRVRRFKCARTNLQLEATLNREAFLREWESCVQRLLQDRDCRIPDHCDRRRRIDGSAATIPTSEPRADSRSL